MSVTAEELAAFADGELDELAAARVARAVEADPDLAAQLAALRSLSAGLRAHYDPILAEPVPQRLSDPLESAAKVVDLAKARARRNERMAVLRSPAWRYGAPAIAACLVLALMIGRGAEPPRPGYAGVRLAAALDDRLSGEAGADGTRILLSFKDRSGAICRAYSGGRDAGIACRDQTGWRIRRSAAAGAGETGEYRQAASQDGAIMAAAQEMAAGPALDRDQELAARGRGWRAP